MHKYPAETPLNEKKFLQCGIVDVLASCKNEYYLMWEAFSKAAELAYDCERFEDCRILWLLADACSLNLKANSSNDPFDAAITTNSGRSAIVSDFITEEIEFLLNVYPHIENNKLAARIADIVWIRRVPRSVASALFAIREYSKIPINNEEWSLEGRNCCERAIVLCIQIKGEALDLLQKIEADLISALLSTTSDNGFLGIWITELLLKYKIGNKSDDIILKLNELALAFAANKKHHLARSYYDIVAKLHMQKDEKDKAYEAIVSCAEEFVIEAEENLSQAKQGNMQKGNLYENAMMKYRTIPRNIREKSKLNARIDELRDKMNTANENSLQEMGVFHTEPIDISEIVKGAKESVTGKDKYESLLALANIHSGASVKQLKELSEDMLRQYPLQALFSSTHLSGDGRVIARNKGANINGPYDDDTLVYEMVKYYTMNLGLIVQGLIWPALEIVRLEHRITESEFINIASQSPIVPLGREHLIGKGLFFGYDNDFSTSIHLLVPQVENIIRYNLKQRGVKTTFIDPNGVETENGLSSLIVNEKVKEVFGEDFAFEIRALFCYQTGANLRNEIAHGLVSQDIGQSAYSIYAWWFCLRIVFNTYHNMLIHIK